MPLIGEKDTKFSLVLSFLEYDVPDITSTFVLFLSLKTHPTIISVSYLNLEER